MPTPQPGIFAERTHSHMLLEYRIKDGIDDASLRRALGAAVRGEGQTAEVTELTGQQSPVNVVWAFGADCWARLDGDAPQGLRPFAGAGKGDTVAPATQRDMFIWFHGDNHSANFDAALAAHRALTAVAEPLLDKNGFFYWDSRDLSGFVDGTENPEGDEQKEVALIPDGEPGAGGSYVFSQQWIHNLDAMHALSQADQEKMIGRTKVDSVELKGDAMPDNSHVSRSDVKVEGVGQKLYRRSVPYGGVTESGLYFLAFSRDIERYERILASMFGTSGDGVQDRLTEMSTPVTGSYWFAPSAEELSRIADF